MILRKVQRGAFNIEDSGNRSNEFKPMTAAAASRCPMFPLIEVHATVEPRRAALAAPISTRISERCAGAVGFEGCYVGSDSRSLRNSLK